MATKPPSSKSLCAGTLDPHFLFQLLSIQVDGFPNVNVPFKQWTILYSTISSHREARWGTLRSHFCLDPWMIEEGENVDDAAKTCFRTINPTFSLDMSTIIHPFHFHVWIIHTSSNSWTTVLNLFQRSRASAPHLHTVNEYNARHEWKKNPGWWIRGWVTL